MHLPSVNRQLTSQTHVHLFGNIIKRDFVNVLGILSESNVAAIVHDS